MLAAVLQMAGYKTGLYTSPHLKDFRERIRINGEMIPENEVIDFVNKHEEDFEKIEPSFFEMTVGLACGLERRTKESWVRIVPAAPEINHLASKTKCFTQPRNRCGTSSPAAVLLVRRPSASKVCFGWSPHEGTSRCVLSA